MGTRRLLGIVASYRKVGNSEIVVMAVAQELVQNCHLSPIRLPKFKIDPCKGCYNCLLPGRKCDLQDDVSWLPDTVSEADAVLFAARNYVLGPVGIVKMVADRTLQAARYYRPLQGKKAAVALISGGEDFRGYADTALSAQVREQLQKIRDAYREGEWITPSGKGWSNMILGLRFHSLHLSGAYN